MEIDPAKILRKLYESDTDKQFEYSSMGALFDPPLVGVADADDLWFDRFKELIGDWHWTPQEALSLSDSQAKARSVVCWCLPVAEVAREANRRQEKVPAREWSYVRNFGEKFLTRMRHGLEDYLRKLDFAALAPAIASQNEVKRRPNVGLSSCWSERHVAFVAGLGTFGISGGLITSRGIAHRIGSVVTDASLEPTPRPYGDDPFAWCPKMSRGTCGVCIKRCPAQSIGETIYLRDKKACDQYKREFIISCGEELYGWKGAYGCGLCQTAVPCEDRNPTERLAENTLKNVD